MIEKIKKEAKHTELPWHVAGNIVTESHGVAIAKCFDRGYETPDVLANAAFIVRACNSHDALLAACEAVRQCLEIMDNGQGNITSGCVFVQLADAIALARKGA
jgi:hypothetical protein